MWKRETQYLFQLLIFICLVSKQSFAEAAITDSISPFISFTHFTEEQGLTSKTVYSCMQDQSGFIWFGTDDGVFRYDGKRFRHYTVSDGISDNEVLKIHQDHYGRIWFLTLNGRLSFWKNGEIHNSSNTAFLKDAYTGASLFSFFEDSKGRAWFGTVAAAFILIDGEVVKKINPGAGTDQPISVYVHEDSHGDLWTFGKKTIINLNTREEFPSNNTEVTQTNACRGKTKTDLFFYAPPGVYKISDHAVSLAVDKSQLPSVKTTISICSDSDFIWVCTSGKGCYEYRNGVFTKHYFPTSTVSSVARDREGNLWFGTLGESVYMLPASNEFVVNLNKSSGITDNNITSIARDDHGSLWLGYSNGSVDEIKNNRKQSFRLVTSDQGAYCRIKDFLIANDTTWCGTDYGIYFIHDGKVTYVPHHGDSGYYAVKQIIRSHGNIYATCHFNILKVQARGRMQDAQELTDSVFRTFAIVEFDTEKLVISGTEGLMEYNIRDKTLISQRPSDELSSFRIADIKMDSEHRLVLANGVTGIHISDHGKIVQHFSTKNGLSDNNCRKIFISGNRMYVATGNGLTILDDKQGAWAVTKIISRADGLLSNVTNDVFADDGKIYVATSQGLSIINDDGTAPGRYIGKVEVTELITDSSREIANDRATFKSDIPRLIIRFAYPVFNPSNVVQVNYRLLKDSKTDSEWLTSMNNEVDFSSLSPGKYIFQLKPGISSEEKSLISNFYLSITPAWWQTIFAKVLLSIAVLSLVVYLVRRASRKKYEARLAKLKQLAMIEAERNRIASDMHDDLGADLTHIAILSEIVAQNNQQQYASEKQLNTIAETSRSVVDKLSEIIWALNSSNDTLSNLISYLRKYSKEYLESKEIACEVLLPDQIPEKILTAAYRRNVFLIFKEALNNIVKHSGSPKAQLQFVSTNHLLEIRLADFGKGFISANNGRVGNGLINMKRRAKENGGALEINFPESGGTIIIYQSLFQTIS